MSARSSVCKMITVVIGVLIFKHLKFKMKDLKKFTQDQSRDKILSLDKVKYPSCCNVGMLAQGFPWMVDNYLYQFLLILFKQLHREYYFTKT